MIKYSFLISIAIIFSVYISQAQTHSFNSNEPKTVIKEIKRDNGQLYNLIITLPTDYRPEKEYKILYYLDAWWLKELVTGCYRLKSLSNKSLANNLDELILVGISSLGDEKAWNKQRNMDFTPSKYNLNIQMNFGSESYSGSTTGGAEEFLQFFKNQVISTIENEYKVDSASRGILGHSLGGLFGFYAYVHHPELFSKYMLLAPAIWWNDSEIFQDKESIVSKREVNMFIAMGTAEINLIKRPMAILIEELKSAKNEKLEMTYKQYENADHHSVLPQAIYDGIGFIYTRSDD